MALLALYFNTYVATVGGEARTQLGADGKGAGEACRRGRRCYEERTSCQQIRRGVRSFCALPLQKRGVCWARKALSRSWPIRCCVSSRALRRNRPQIGAKPTAILFMCADLENHPFLEVLATPYLPCIVLSVYDFLSSSNLH